jgi:glycosyltransferase involved in cell wall biosynthesis
MYLAIVVKDLTGGGAARAMVKLANGLVVRHRVDMVLVKATGPYLDELSPLVRVVDLNARRTITAIPAMIRYLRGQQPQAVLSALRHINVMSIVSRALSLARCCLIVTERNMVALSAASTPRRRDRLFFFLIPLLYRMADGVVAIARDIHDELLGRFRLPAHKLHLIYNPIVSEEMIERAAELVDEQWFHDDAPTVLAVGRLFEHKNHSVLLRAFASAAEEDSARLLILGEGPERARLEALALELGIEHRLDMPGFVPNVYKFMSRSDLLVHTSRWEGLPGVLIEALACEVPIVAVDSPGGVSEVLEAGRYGRLVPSDDFDALVGAIREGLHGKIPSPSRTAWIRFEQGAVVAEYEALLRECGGDQK